MNWEDLMMLIGLRSDPTVTMGSARAYDAFDNDVTQHRAYPGGLIGPVSGMRNGVDVSNYTTDPRYLRGVNNMDRYTKGVIRDYSWVKGRGATSDKPVDPFAPIAFTVER